MGLAIYLFLEFTIYPNNIYFSVPKFGEQTVFPFMASLAAVLIAALVAPRFKIAVSLITLTLIVFLYIEIMLLKSMGVRVAYPDKVVVIMQCLGALKGLMIVVRYYYPQADDV